MALDGLINGEVKFANGVQIMLSEEGWLSLFKFIHTHLDGPVKPDPEPLDVINWTPDEWRKEAAARHNEAANTLATFDDETPDE